MTLGTLILILLGTLFVLCNVMYYVIRVRRKRDGTVFGTMIAAIDIIVLLILFFTFIVVVVRNWNEVII